jgi:hypothetical protein
MGALVKICSCIALAVFSILFSTITAQNLVPNPSFEIFDKCPKDYNVEYKKILVPGWYMPTGGTSDYFNVCAKAQVGVPQNFMGNCLAKDGGAYAGIILILEPPADSTKPAKINYREYLGTKLDHPLIKGQWYVVRFYFSIPSRSTYAVNRLGAYFSEEKIGHKLSTGVLSYKPQVYMDSVRMVTEKETWFEVVDTIQAKGNEQYMTIGNFYNDKQTRYEPLSLAGLSKIQQAKVTESQMAYYYIDWVSVTRIDR